mmetsp:Transcript_8226/g.26268  ORF Transcript_8226/g.26268 Transcript_8226/m.26268 type:complete len:244 (-) Transcript_8226:1693-2424(-)
MPYVDSKGNIVEHPPKSTKKSSKSPTQRGSNSPPARATPPLGRYALYALGALAFFSLAPSSTNHVESTTKYDDSADNVRLINAFTSFTGAASYVGDCAAVSPLTTIERQDGKERGSDASFDDHVVTDISLFTAARHPAAPDICIPFVFVGMDRGEYSWGGTTDAWHATASSYAAILPNCSVAFVSQNADPMLLSEEAAAAALTDKPLFLACVAGIPVSAIAEAKERMDTEDASESTDPSAYEL